MLAIVRQKMRKERREGSRWWKVKMMSDPREPKAELVTEDPTSSGSNL